MMLANKVAIVTGGDSGIGHAISVGLAREGAAVTINYHRDQAAAEETLRHIQQEGGKGQVIQADVANPADIQKLVDETVRAFGRLDVMVNNAGMETRTSLLDTTERQFDLVIGVDLKSAFFGTQMAARQMIKQGGGGRIVNIASQAAKSAFPHAVAYCSSKHGVVGLTRVAALELGSAAITVNAVCPNHVTTGLGAWQNEYFAAKQGKSVEQYLADMRARIPLGRPGLPSDMAAATAWLCSDDAVYVTGEAINISGGEENH